MFCKSYTRIGNHSNGKQLVAADLITKAAPETMPTTTDGIDNIAGGWMLGPGSTMLCTNPFGVKVMNDELTWDDIELS